MGKNKKINFRFALTKKNNSIDKREHIPSYRDIGDNSLPLALVTFYGQ